MEVVCTLKRLPSPLSPLFIEPRPGSEEPWNPSRVRRIGFLIVYYWNAWNPKDGRLRVGFLDTPPRSLRRNILSHMNAWSKTANVRFFETATDPHVRIARVGGVNGGYWSYLGTEILRIPRDQPTMNLQEFTLNTPEEEFQRVVRHETGHTLGFGHEHMRRSLVEKINPQKAIEYYRRTENWSELEVRAQILTPIEESSTRGSLTDPESIMCYQIPGEITWDGKPIPGGSDISPMDYEFAAHIYPKKSKPKQKTQ